MSKLPEGAQHAKEIRIQASPGPWGPYAANYPFYADVRKPAPSLSKHDDERPTYWLIQDARFIATASVYQEKFENSLELAMSCMGCDCETLGYMGARGPCHSCKTRAKIEEIWRDV